MARSPSETRQETFSRHRGVQCPNPGSTTSPRREACSSRNPNRGCGRSQSEGFSVAGLLQPTKAELSTLIGPFGLHPLAIEDLMTSIRSPRSRNFPEHLHHFHALSYADKKLAVDEVDLFISEKYLITVSGGVTRRRDGSGRDRTYCGSRNRECQERAGLSDARHPGLCR